MGRDHDHRQVRAALAQAIQRGHAVDARQAEVQQDDVDVIQHLLQRRLATVGRADTHALPAQCIAERAHQRFFIVDD